MNASISQDQTARYYERQVQAFRRHFPDLPPYCVCPLCLRGFLREALDQKELTLEHAPPECFGGHALVLTCRRCNCEAGAGIDAELAKFMRVRDFGLARMASPRHGRLEMNGLNVNVLFSLQKGKLEVTDWANRNDRERITSLTQELEHIVETRQTGWNATLTFVQDAYRRGWPDVSLLRAAYLVGFAALGFRYAFRETFSLIRRQITEPNEEIVKGFINVALDASDEHRSIVITKDPPWLRCVVVQIGQFRIFLPLFDNDSDLYETLARVRGEGASVKMTGLQWPWPRRGEFALDFQPVLVRAIARGIVTGSPF